MKKSLLENDLRCNRPELDSEKNEYRLIDDFTKTPWPFHHYDSPLVAFIPEYGVTMWVDSKVILYKHDALGEGT